MNLSQNMGISGRLPDLIIIGAQKAGTTSLHYYLNQHPQIMMSRIKELRFFTLEHNWSRGVNWYRSFFKTQAKLCGETTPSYSDFPRHSGVPDRMYSLIPDARLVYLIRDPIERLVSQYMHLYAIRLEHRSLEDAVNNRPDDSSYINRSRYYLQLQQYLPYYSLDNILFIMTEDLQDRRNETLATVFRFLGVDETFTTPSFQRVKHASTEKRRLTRSGRILHDFSYDHMNPVSPAAQRLITRWLEYPLSLRFDRPELSEALWQRLQEVLRPDIEHLRALTGLSFSQWSI